MFYDNYVALCASVEKSPSAVARELGINKSTVSCWKSRKASPSDVNAKRVADYFGVTVEELMDNGTKKEPAENGKLSYAQLELIELSRKMSDDELRKFIAAMKAMIGE